MSKRSFSEAFDEFQPEDENLEGTHEHEMSAMEKVLSLPDTLEAVFKFLDTKNLLKCRTVCRLWRSISDASLKQHFNLKTATKIDSLVYLGPGPMAERAEFGNEAVMFIGHETNVNQDPQEEMVFDRLELQDESYFYWEQIPPLEVIGNTPDHIIPVENQYLLLQDHQRNLLKRRVEWREVKPMPWFISSVLQLDWLPSVTKLILDRCLTVDDWNAAANAILSKFPALDELILLLPQERNKILPLVYAELGNEPEVGLSLLKTIKVHYVIDYDKPKPKCMKNQRKRLRSVCWDFLKHCRNLETFYARISFGRPPTRNILKACVRAKRDSAAWEVKVYDRLVSWRDRPADLFVEYDSVVADDISTIVTFFKPLHLQLPFQPLLNSKITPEVKDQVLSLSYSSFTESSSSQIAASFSFAATFKNLLKLHWVPFCKHGLDSFDDMDVDHVEPMLNLVTLMLTDTNSWMNQHLPTIAPNVQLLVASFRVGVFRSGISDMLRVLRLAYRLPNLKHLVLLAESHTDEMRNSAALCHWMSTHNGEYLTELKSFTTIVKHPVDLLRATKSCIQLFEKKSTYPLFETGEEEPIQLQSIGVYKLSLNESRGQEEENTDQLDLSALKVPSHLTVKAASTRVLGIGEAKFEGMESSYLIWPELCRKPRKRDL